MTMEDAEERLKEEIRRLKEEKGAIILAHNYQIPAVQDVADFVGDSLGLSQQAAKTDAKIIVFCGVHFMAETAAILCPDKKVLIPDPNAGCSLAASITAEQLRELKKKHPNAIVVSYVNTTADVKAESDYCCTSSNALKVIESLPADKEIIFVPDMFLGAYVQSKTGRKMHIWPGECHVHAGIKSEEVMELLERYPDADFLIHPECGCTTQFCYLLTTNSFPNGRVYMYSTEGMVKHVRSSPKHTFVIGTETGILYRMRKEAPGKKLIPVKDDAVCQYMKMITLEKVYRSLRDEVYEVRVPKEVAERARKAIERMLEIT